MSRAAYLYARDEENDSRTCIEVSGVYNTWPMSKRDDADCLVSLIS
jgi:hypothetical protein